MVFEDLVKEEESLKIMYRSNYGTEKLIVHMKRLIMDKCSKMPDRSQAMDCDRIEDNPNKLTEEQAEQFTKDIFSIESMDFMRMSRKQLLIHICFYRFIDHGQFMDYNNMREIEEN